MSFFRYLGDIVHLASLLILIWKIRESKSCVGLSCKT
jgi:ER lumen protein retaining receptor